MITDTHMSIVEEVRSFKEAVAAKHGFDVARIVEAARVRQDASGRRIIRQGEQGEVWKTARETWREAAGDCEDTSILLADVLIGAGFDARVAIGWNGNIGQHAWVVVRLGDRQYILESTLQKKIERSDLAAIGDASAFYQPEQLFDRDEIYYTTARADHFRVDYFARDLWKPVPGMSEPGAALSVR